MEIYSRTVNLSEEVWFSLYERSLLLPITPVDVIICINNSGVIKSGGCLINQV